MVKEMWKRLELDSWDNWLPLTVIAVFIVLGAIVGTGAVNFRVPFGDLDRVHTAYTEIGIQTTAGIFAIIVTLSLVAIQFASQEYSHRIMDAYVKSVMFWSTIVVYLGVMIAGIVLQANATQDEDIRVVGIMLVGSILTLILLVPHFIITASYLKPEFLIHKLLRRVDREYLASIVPLLEQGKGRIDGQTDRLLPVVEMIERSIDRGDLATTRVALNRLHQTYLSQAESMNSMPIERYFLDYLLRIGRKAVSAMDEEEAAVQAIAIVGVVGSQGPAAELAVENLDNLGFAALKHDSEPAVHQMIDSLRTVFTTTQSQNAKKAVLASYQDLVGQLASGQRERLLRHLVTTLTEIAQAALDSHDRATAVRCLDLLEAAGHDAATHGIVNVVLQLTQSLQKIGVASAAEDADTAEGIVRVLLRIEQALSPRERELIAATEFAKRDIERAIRRARPVSSPGPPAAVVVASGLPAAQDAAEPGPTVDPSESKKPTPATDDAGEGGLDLTDLWSKADE